MFFAKGPIDRVARVLIPGSSANVMVNIERDAFSRANPIRLRLLDLKLV